MLRHRRKPKPRSNSLKRPCGTSGNAMYRRIYPPVEHPSDDSHFMLRIWSSLTKSEFSHSPMIDDFLAIGTRGYAIAVDLSCSSDALKVVPDDGRTVSVPLVWFPRLLTAMLLRNRGEWEFTLPVLPSKTGGSVMLLKFVVTRDPKQGALQLPAVLPVSRQ